MKWPASDISKAKHMKQRPGGAAKIIRHSKIGQTPLPWKIRSPAPLAPPPWSSIWFRTSLVVEPDILCSAVDEMAGRRHFQGKTHETTAGGCGENYSAQRNRINTTVMEDAFSRAPRVPPWSSIWFRTSLVVEPDILCSAIDEMAGKQLFKT